LNHHRRFIGTTCFRYTIGLQSRGGGTRTHALVLPRHAGCRCPTPRTVVTVRTAGFEPAVSWPPTRRDPRLRHVLTESTPCGSRTRIAGLKDRHPEPLDERGVQRVDRGALESPSAAFQAAATPSQLPIRTADKQKSPMSRVTPGFVKSSFWHRGRVSQAQRMGGTHVRRLTGKAPVALRFANETRPQDHHRKSSG
jgi:hypothetical protein